MSDVTKGEREDSPHQFEFSVWRDKADRAIAVEFAELDALMELTVVELDERILDRSEFGRLWNPFTVSSAQSAGASKEEEEKTDDLSSISLSFNPNLHSGVPLRYARIRI